MIFLDLSHFQICCNLQTFKNNFGQICWVLECTTNFTTLLRGSRFYRDPKAKSTVLGDFLFLMYQIYCISFLMASQIKSLVGALLYTFRTQQASY